VSETFYLNPSAKKTVAIITSSFLGTFFISRLFVYLVLGHLAPNFFLTIRGVHIHHFTYGFIILAITGIYLLIKHPAPGSHLFKWLAWFYGIGLGLSTDEFGMWIRLEDEYWVRQSYDAIIILTLILINIAFLPQLLSWIKEMIANAKEYFYRK